MFRGDYTLPPEEQKGRPFIWGNTVKGKTFLVNRPGLSGKDVGNFMRSADETIKDLAPFVAGGQAAAPLGMIKGSALVGGVAGADEAAKQGVNIATGQQDGFDFVEVGKQAALGSLAEFGGRLLLKPIEGIIKRVVGDKVSVFNEDGTFTDDVLNKLKSEGADSDGLNQFIKAELQKKDILTKEQAERFNLFKQQGIDPTKAQVTQRADDFQFQQEVGKTSGPVRDRLTEQNQQILNRADDITTQSGIDAESTFTTGESVLKAIDQKTTDLDELVGKAYKAARDNLPEGVFRTDKLTNLVHRFSSDNTLSSGVVGSVRAEMKRLGFIQPEKRRMGTDLVSRRIDSQVSVETAEKLRQHMNAVYPNANGRGKFIIRALKDALDDDVSKAVGKDIFKDARKAKVQFHAQLERVKRSKFDKNTKSTVLDLLEGKIPPDHLFEKLVVQKGTSKEGLDAVKKFLLEGTPEQQAFGKQAWDNLRGETLKFIFKGSGKDELGNAVINGNQVRKAMGKVGMPKVVSLFDGKERKAISDLLKVIELRDPVAGTALGQGPTAQAVNQAIKRLPMLGDVMESIGIGQRAIQTKSALNPAAKTASAVVTQPSLRPAATTVGQDQRLR